MKVVKTKNIEQWYSSTEIDKTNATYRLIIGQRSNGKTYNIIKKIITEWFKTGLPSVYVRRFAEDIMPKNLNSLIAPHYKLIEKLSNGEYNNVVYRSQEFRFAFINEDGKTLKRSKPFLFTVALNNWERSKGSDRGQIKYFVFDEFMTRMRFLANEFTVFANVHSTFCRNREGIVTYMLANTVNKYCPYFDEMGLNPKIEKVKQGQICLWTYNDDRLTVAVEYCNENKHSEIASYYYAFDNPALEMIKTGAWEEDSYPHLEDFTISEENIIFKFYVKFNYKIVIGKVIQEGPHFFIFFHPAQSDLKALDQNDIVYTEKPTTYCTWFHQFGDESSLPALENFSKILRECVHNQKVFYSSNSVGEVIRNFLLNKFSAFNEKY
jgi:hypothetical protein